MTGYHHGDSFRGSRTDHVSNCRPAKIVKKPPTYSRSFTCRKPGRPEILDFPIATIVWKYIRQTVCFGLSDLRPFCLNYLFSIHQPRYTVLASSFFVSPTSSLNDTLLADQRLAPRQESKFQKDASLSCIGESDKIPFRYSGRASFQIARYSPCSKNPLRDIIFLESWECMAPAQLKAGDLL
jgi:hypothetical protein